MLRLIGDVHGKYDKYFELIEYTEYSLQVGDLGLCYDHLDDLDFDRHRAVQGNHDNYGIPRHPIFLGDYGVHQFGDIKVFYVRGAWSIDWQRRTPGYDWWPEEELSLEQAENAFELYKQEKPNLVITHEAPYKVVPRVTNPQFATYFGYPAGQIATRTNALLQRMLDFHQPVGWFFGHYHTYNKFQLDEYHTIFHCLDMIGGYSETPYYDLN